MMALTWRQFEVWGLREGPELLGPLPSSPASPPSLALSSLNKHAEAVAYYKKALELDPDNETYKSNLKIAELKLREAPSPVSPPGNKGVMLSEAEHRAGQTDALTAHRLRAGLLGDLAFV